MFEWPSEVWWFIYAWTLAEVLNFWRIATSHQPEVCKLHWITRIVVAIWRERERENKERTGIIQNGPTCGLEHSKPPEKRDTLYDFQDCIIVYIIFPIIFRWTFPSPETGSKCGPSRVYSFPILDLIGCCSCLFFIIYLRWWSPMISMLRMGWQTYCITFFRVGHGLIPTSTVHLVWGTSRICYNQSCDALDAEPTAFAWHLFPRVPHLCVSFDVSPTESGESRAIQGQWS